MEVFSLSERETINSYKTNCRLRLGNDYGISFCKSTFPDTNMGVNDIMLNIEILYVSPYHQRKFGCQSSELRSSKTTTIK